MRSLLGIALVLVGCAGHVPPPGTATPAPREALEAQQDAGANAPSNVLEEAVVAAVGYHQRHRAWPTGVEALLADFVAQHGAARYLDEHRLREVAQEDDGRLRMVWSDDRIEAIVLMTPPIIDDDGITQVNVDTKVRPLEDEEPRKPGSQLFRDPL